MRSPFILVLIAGLGLSGLAVYMVQGYLDQQRQALLAAQAAQAQIVEDAPPVVPTVEVYAAGQRLRYGQTLDENMVTTILWPEEHVPEGAFVAGADAMEIADGEAPPEPLLTVRPRQVLRAVDPGEILLKTKVTKPGGEAGITSMLKPGMRAFSIKVDVLTGVSGFLRPGDEVDVFWTGRIQGREVTRLVGASMPIIAVDQNADMDSNDTEVARTVSVMAPPTEVAGLTHAQSTGRLTLSLVGVNDIAPSAEFEIDSRTLFGIEDEPEPEPEPEVVVAPAPEVCTIRARRGGQTQDVVIPCPD